MNMRVEKTLMVVSWLMLALSFFTGPAFWILFPLALTLSVIVTFVVFYKVRAMIALKRIEAVAEAMEELRHDRRDKGGD